MSRPRAPVRSFEDPVRTNVEGSPICGRRWAVRPDKLDEIERWILPMTRRELPTLEDYMSDLVADCRALGWLDVSTGTNP